MDKQIGKLLDDYIERMRPVFTPIQQSTAHEIASAFLAYRFGLYRNAARECIHAIPLVFEGGAGHALKKALSIVKSKAENLDNSQIITEPPPSFSSDELQYVPVVLSPEKNEDPATLELDNALVLLYAATITTSPDDQEALEEHRKYVVTVLTAYKTALGF